MSCHPSPSTSTNAQPDPSVSGRYLPPNAPLLWTNRIPAAADTSVNVTPDAASAPIRVATYISDTVRTTRLIFFALALGPHPQRELTLTPRLGSPCPRLGVAAGAFALALGPHPQRELSFGKLRTSEPARGEPVEPRLSVAAGACRRVIGARGSAAVRCCRRD